MGMNDFAERLRRTVADEEPLLRAIPDSAANASPDPQRWSKKQELGHLVDSATNNRVRFAKAALEGRFDGPSYDSRGWVELGGYAQMPWAELVDLWRALNIALAALVSRIPEERRSAECRIGESLSAPLEFVIDDYIQHMQHHLDHILSRKQVRSYPSASR
jgi:hypothetical protein